MLRPTRPIGVSNGLGSCCPGWTLLDAMLVNDKSSMDLAEGLRALLENRSVFYINVKKMDLLVLLGYDSLVIDPNQ